MEFKIFNSLTKKKETFVPIESGAVNMYVCGVTPYDFSHVGHGRCYVTFDTLYRVLLATGYNVKYARNYTDIDDKLLNKAAQSNSQDSYIAIANKFISLYQKDMEALGCLTPTVEPRVTQEIDAIIDFISDLIKQKKAYIIDNDVYFDVSMAHNYGLLSGKKIEELEIGRRVDLDIRKKNPYDFALWKGNASQEFWLSPWGYGRPGWHIECSAMIGRYLGKTIDIHGGGMDLMFPHHENEIAQSEGRNNKKFVKYWLHNAFINVKNTKMSKSLGNIIRLVDLFEQYDPMVVRYFFLQHHYRTPICFDVSLLDAAEKAYEKLVRFFRSVPNVSIQPVNLFHNIRLECNHEIVASIINALCDDLNVTKAIGIIFHEWGTIGNNELLKRSIKAILTHVFGLSLLEQKEQLSLEVQQLITERDQARKKKNWVRADQIREKLLSMGVSVNDSKAQ